MEKSKKTLYFANIWGFFYMLTPWFTYILDYKRHTFSIKLLWIIRTSVLISYLKSEI